MTVSTDDLVPFEMRNGPVHVVHEDGTPVAYGPSARLDLIDPDRKDAWVVDELQLTIFDEGTVSIRQIPANLILKVERPGPGFRVTVDHSVEPDDGDAVRTRGA